MALSYFHHIPLGESWALFRAGHSCGIAWVNWLSLASFLERLPQLIMVRSGKPLARSRNRGRRSCIIMA